MPWLPMYMLAPDRDWLLNFLNEEIDIAFIVPSGKQHGWKVVDKINNFEQSRIDLWHKAYGLLQYDSPEKKLIQDPYAGWVETIPGANPRRPYFGVSWPTHISLDIRLFESPLEPDTVGMSSFEWIGNHYSILGWKAPTGTEKWWQRLRRHVAKNATKIPRAQMQNLKPEIYALPAAFKKIENGAACALNP